MQTTTKNIKMAFKHNTICERFIYDDRIYFYYLGKIGRPKVITIKYHDRTFYGIIQGFPKDISISETVFVPRDFTYNMNCNTESQYRTLLESGIIMQLNDNIDSLVKVPQFLQFLRSAKTPDGRSVLGYIVYDHEHGVPYILSINNGDISCDVIDYTTILTPRITKKDGELYVDDMYIANPQSLLFQYIKQPRKSCKKK